VRVVGHRDGSQGWFVTYTRNPLNRNFQNWKGTAYVPEKTDASLRWSEIDPMDMLPMVTASP
jgi:hypothetical protein